MYTSGTTGFPRGAMHAHQMIRNVTERASVSHHQQDAIMMYLPLFHLFAFGRHADVAGDARGRRPRADPAESLS
jgi:long-subunit acyl-CoA synthetase (AMP-forming)